MDTNSVWKLLSGLEVGTIVAWCAVIITIIGLISAGTIKLYKIFTKYKDMKDKNIKLESTVDSHEQELKKLSQQLADMNANINQQFSDIKSELNDQRNTKIKELRHSITVAGENALANGKISIREWTSLHEMCDEYMHKYKQNWYVEPLMKKIDRDVEIIGKIDEHGNDIID